MYAIMDVSLHVCCSGHKLSRVGMLWCMKVLWNEYAIVDVASIAIYAAMYVG